MTKTQKGFTLIELLVVIAIIGILAGTLFIAINPKEQSDKAKDSRIKSTLGQIPTQAAMIDATSYENVCADDNDKIKKLRDAVIEDSQESDDDHCKADKNTFAMSVQLNTKGKDSNGNDIIEYACVDATGLHIVTQDKDADATVCPAS